MGAPRDHWDKVYRDGTYRSQWDYDHPSQELIGAICGIELPQGSRVLDLGCGTGQDATYLAQQEFTTSGIDLSPVAIEIARERAGEVTVDWRVGDVLDLPYQDSGFDLITDRACFHHIPDADRPKYASEVARTLKAGGHLILRGSRKRREDSFYEVTEMTIREFFPAAKFSIGKVFPIWLKNNAGGLTANMVVIRRV